MKCCRNWPTSCSSATSRAGEVVARYGGEEFILVLPGRSRQSALRTAPRLQA